MTFATETLPSIRIHLKSCRRKIKMLFDIILLHLNVVSFVFRNVSDAEISSPDK